MEIHCEGPGNYSVTLTTKLEMFLCVLSSSICMQNFVEFELIITEFCSVLYSVNKIENEKNMPEFEELTETFTADGLEEEAGDKAYLTILPKLRKDIQSIYLDRLLWITQMKKDTIHKQIMKTNDAFVNDDNFDPVDKRKFLMKGLISGLNEPHFFTILKHLNTLVK